MKSTASAGPWMVVGLVVACLLASFVLAGGTITPQRLGTALRVTARWSFVLFWISYSSSAIATLAGPAFALSAQSGRVFGLAFAAAQAVHVALVLLLYWILGHDPLSPSLTIFFGVAVFCTYLLALLSFDAAWLRLRPNQRRIVMIIGSNYILLAFAKDFIPPVFRISLADRTFSHGLAYLPFAALCVMAPVLRLMATIRGKIDPPSLSWTPRGKV